MRHHDRPVDPLIARREASLLDLTPPGTQPTFDRGRRFAPAHDAEHVDVEDGEDGEHGEYGEYGEFGEFGEGEQDDGYDGGRVSGGDGTDGFALFDDGPEPVAAWDRSPAVPRQVPPQLKVLAAILATVVVIWAMAAVRGPADDGTQTPTVDIGATDTTVITATMAISVEQNAGTTTVQATVTSTSDIDTALWNHVWIVRDGLEFPEATAFVGCLAVDDQLGKPFTGTYQVVTPVTDASRCGLGGFTLAPGAGATVSITALGLAPGDYRVLLAAWTSERFTVV